MFRRGHHERRPVRPGIPGHAAVRARDVAGVDRRRDGSRRRERRVVRRRRGVVVAAGARSADLARQCGDDVPLDTERGYHVRWGLEGEEEGGGVGARGGVGANVTVGGGGVATGRRSRATRRRRSRGRCVRPRAGSSRRRCRAGFGPRASSSSAGWTPRPWRRGSSSSSAHAGAPPRGRRRGARRSRRLEGLVGVPPDASRRASGDRRRAGGSRGDVRVRSPARRVDPGRGHGGDRRGPRARTRTGGEPRALLAEEVREETVVETVQVNVTPDGERDVV